MQNIGFSDSINVWQHTGGGSTLLFVFISALCLLTGGVADARFITENYTLTSNEDWTSDVAVLLTNGVTVNLNGNSLAVPELKVVSGTEVAAGYIQLEYVEATGKTGKQWINTEYTPVCTDRVEMDIRTSATVATGNQCLFCSRVKGSDRTFTCFTISGVLRIDRNKSQTNSQVALSPDTRYLVVANGDTLDFSTNGVIVCSMVTGTFTPANPFVLFASYNNVSNPSGIATTTSWDNWGAYRLYSFQVYDKDDNLQCDAVPACRTSDGAIGLYDRQRNRFLTNSGRTPLDFSESGNATVANQAVGDAPSLTVTVSRAVTNSLVALSGNLKLVKEGSGEFTAHRREQTYTGGTEVKAGALKVTAYGKFHQLGAVGSTNTVSVVDGVPGILDMNGIPAYQQYVFVENGGKIRNQVNIANSTSYAYISDLRLDADSSFDAWYNYGLINAGYGRVDLTLNGHTLKVNETSKSGTRPLFLLVNVTATTPGTIEVMNGYFYFDGSSSQKRKTSDFQQVTLVMNGQLRLDDDTGSVLVKLRDYIVNTPAADVSGAGAAKFMGRAEVYGTFRPNTDFFHGCELQDGATIDLSGRNGTFSAKGQNVGTNDVQTTATFAPNASITVNLAGREDLRALAASAAPYVISWETQPENVLFEPDAQTKTNKFILQPNATGLKLIKVGGTVISIR
ncbi:MAG: hypothetical protein IJR99_02935 [Kiritimatiellae bacterium]|nr:hypothetical protein [Kiritimatiellia bacterium]